MAELNGNDASGATGAGESHLQGLFKDIYGYLAGDSAREFLGHEPRPMPGFEKLLNMVTEAMESSPMTIVPPRNPIVDPPEKLSTFAEATVTTPTVKPEPPQYSGHVSSSNTEFSPKQHNFVRGSELSVHRRIDSRPNSRNVTRIGHPSKPPMDLTSGIDREIQGPPAMDNVQLNSVLQKCKDQIDSLKDALAEDFTDCFPPSEPKPSEFPKESAINENYPSKMKRFSQFASPLDIGSMMACNILDDFVGAGASFRDVPESACLRASASQCPTPQQSPSFSCNRPPTHLSAVSSSEDFHECSGCDFDLM